MATGIAIADRNLPGKIAGVAIPWNGVITNRSVAIPGSRLHTFPMLELTAFYRLWRGTQPEAVFQSRNTRFQELIPDRWITEATHVIGFDTSAAILAERCRDLDRPLILDQSIGHSRAKEKVFSHLQRRYPAWAGTIPTKTTTNLMTEDAEQQGAKHIVAPSSFVRQTLVENGVNPEKISVIPFGTDVTVFRPSDTIPPGPLIFLYAGSLTARKGLPVLLEAWKRVDLKGKAELWIAGGGELPRSVTLPAYARVLGKVSQTRLAETMRLAHVFVFPSCFEGLAQVQVEALATGLPVIGTRASGAEDIVAPGKTGFILKGDDPDELAERLISFLHEPGLMESMRLNCVGSRQKRSWSYYGDHWFDLLSELR